jgi:hypothetical protein
MKTIISANVPIGIAIRLKDKTKGTRSRVVARALEAYLDEKDAFDITDVDTQSLVMELIYRKDISKSQKSYLTEMWKELRNHEATLS